MKRPGIHIRLLFAAFVLICASTFTLGAVGVSITRQFMLSRFKDRMAFLARYLALNAEVGVLVGNKSALEDLATNLLGEADVVRVTISDKDDMPLIDIGKTVSTSLSVVETPVRIRKLADADFLFGPDSAQGLSQPEAIGKVRITYSTRGIDQVMGLIKRRHVYLSAGLAGLAGLVFFFISRSIVRQVTDLAQAARQVANGDLDLRAHPGSLPETSELALAFNAMLDSLAKSREDLARANQQMIRQGALAEVGKFSLMVAHEVKNPLSIIKGSLDVLKKDPASATSTTMIEYIEDEVQRLNRLIEDFLAFARPSRPCFRLLDLNAVLQQIVSRFKVQRTGTLSDLQSRIPAAPLHASADADLLTRALGNIIKNACEADGGKGVVRITASCLEDTWRVDVEDEGEGIAEENMDKIFEPFFTTRAKGTGLGLAFALQVIKAHGGTITAKNRRHGGALFTVELPIGNPDGKRSGLG